MTVRAIHHLNAGTMAPFTAGVPGVMPKEFVAHCLVVETESRLIVVDTGFGTADVRLAARRLGRPFTALTRPALLQTETVVAQLPGLGYEPYDVTDIVLTHLDLDHAGGIADFPHARVHVHESELAAARHPKLNERARYVAAQWAHGPRWEIHQGAQSWFGFAGVDPVSPDGDGSVMLIPLRGHTRGHQGVAVQNPGGGWLLHAGDAYFHADDVVAGRPSHRGLRVVQSLLGVDQAARRENLVRLQELRSTHPHDVRIFCAHDRREYEALKRNSPGSPG